MPLRWGDPHPQFVARSTVMVADSKHACCVGRSTHHLVALWPGANKFSGRIFRKEGRTFSGYGDSMEIHL